MEYGTEEMEQNYSKYSRRYLPQEAVCLHVGTVSDTSNSCYIFVLSVCAALIMQIGTNKWQER